LIKKNTKELAASKASGTALQGETVAKNKEITTLKDQLTGVKNKLQETVKDDESKKALVAELLKDKQARITREEALQAKLKLQNLELQKLQATSKDLSGSVQ
jgi:predicted nuclease with TOPRIM domain